MKYAIINRWTGDVIFEAEIECKATASEGFKLGLSVRAAVKARANLADANLTGANLARANLAGANLTHANLTGATLTHANLADANLADAYLTGANLTGATLTRANLADAYLAGAYLARANLAGATLTGANLAGANLTGANLTDAKWYDVVIKRPPIQIFNLPYLVIIFDNHMHIGCELYTLKDWANFEDPRIIEMDGAKALRFWKQYKDVLLALAKSDGRGVSEF